MLIDRSIGLGQLLVRYVNKEHVASLLSCYRKLAPELTTVAVARCVRRQHPHCDIVRSHVRRRGQHNPGPRFAAERLDQIPPGRRHAAPAARHDASR